jgi:hypothetical protein
MAAKDTPKASPSRPAEAKPPPPDPMLMKGITAGGGLKAHPRAEISRPLRRG